MPQVKIYGYAAQPLDRNRLHYILDSCFVEVLGLNSGVHPMRFIALEKDEFLAPSRGERYLIIEITMFAGRPVELRKSLIREVIARCVDKLGLEPIDVEVILYEVPSHNWGMKGVPADELQR